MNKEKAYIVFRGTNTKQGFFAKDFNIKDTLSSHVGLMVSNQSWKVYHVIENKSDSSDYRIQSMHEFVSGKEDKVFYFSLWEITSLKNQEIDLLKMKLDLKEKSGIKFDRSFTHTDSTMLYCSEFVCETLKKVSPSKFNFNYHYKELKGIYKTYFKRDTLEYYPVDMFMYDSNFKKIYEWYKE